MVSIALGTFPVKKEISLFEKVVQRFQEPPLPLRYQNWWEFSQIYKRISKLQRKQHDELDVLAAVTTHKECLDIVDFFDINGRLAPLKTTKGEPWNDLALFHAYLGEHDYDIGSTMLSTIKKIPRESPAIFIPGKDWNTTQQYTRATLTTLVRDSFHAIEDAMNKGHDTLVFLEGSHQLYTPCYATRPKDRKLFLIPGYG
jgi:hypothetical protein